MSLKLAPSEYINIEGLEYFKFEEDFIEDNLRCIPMIVRFKMDAVGIKLKLNQWTKFISDEKIKLAIFPTSNEIELNIYEKYLNQIIVEHSNVAATLIEIENNPQWKQLEMIPKQIIEKLLELKLMMNITQWKNLTNLQRFTLLKLCRDGHENINFPKAFIEFGLLNKQNNG